MASPQVGIGAMILDSSRRKIVFGKRKGSHGAGTWAIPGGHLEFGESFEECAAREVLEETGLVVRNVKFLTATNSVFREEGKHYVTIFVGCEISEGEGQVPVVMEPEKCEEWEWVDWEDVRRWARMQMEGKVGGEGSDGDGERNSRPRKLFLPMVDLCSQRPKFHPAESLNTSVGAQN